MDKSNKLVVINRAIPGGGKTSEYFIQIDEEGFRRYVFDKKKLNEYHQNNQEAFKQALESNIDIVVCDNTNFESWQSKPYTDMARGFGYKILLIDFKPRELELHLEAQKITQECPDVHQD
ncbi:AAA family ATPase [Helicobacter pylori]